MDRTITFPGAIDLDTDVLQPQQNAMLAFGAIIQAVLGTGTVVSGLNCAPTSPASMNVNVAPGAIFTLATVEATSYGSLPTDSNPLMKCGQNEATTTFALTAPGTGGFSQNYLIEAEFLEADDVPVVLPYYDAADPTHPYSGPANAGTPQDTVRKQRCSLQLKAGTPATAGTQTTPAVDAGWVGLWVITVNNGASSINSGNIHLYPNAPFIPYSLPQLTPGARVATITGTNTLVATTSDGGAPVLGELLIGLAQNTNTGAVTLNLNGAGAVSVTYTDGSALIAGELTAGQVVFFGYGSGAWEALAVNPSMLKAPINQSLTNPGHAEMPGGLIHQWGTGTLPGSSETTSITFPRVFPTECFGMFLQQQNLFSGGSPALYDLGVDSVNTTTGHISTGNVSATNGFDINFYWHAIGH